MSMVGRIPKNTAAQQAAAKELAMFAAAAAIFLIPGALLLVVRHGHTRVGFNPVGVALIAIAIAINVFGSVRFLRRSRAIESERR
jgi:hypothetical protein